MNLPDLMRRHAESAIANSAHLAEEATWHYAGGGQDRQVRVVVNRQQLEPANGIGGTAASARSARVWLARNSINGVTAVADGDEITVAIRLGAPPERCRIVEVVTEGHGGFLLQVMR